MGDREQLEAACRVEKAVIQAGEVNDALALLMVLLDAAHDRKVSAEQVRCLLEPLQERLEGALERLRDGFRCG